ncbi:MAG TPA: carbohydrate kinase family protein [Gaiellales bacterium]|nr:carbohydrate kinase family protein [Gaiellales bacterium]
MPEASSLDVVCAGPPFLDITFSGLEALPSLGEERLARSISLTAGGLANVALGATRLGLRAGMFWPVGGDLLGRILADLLAAEGIEWIGPSGDGTAVSAIMPLDGDRAFLTVAPEHDLDGEGLAALGARAVVLDVPSLARAPAGVPSYAVIGDVAARDLAGRPPAELARARAMIVNEAEARLLSGEQDAEQAARALAGLCSTVVVTLGDRGAICAGAHGLIAQPAPRVPVIDTNGAGDLFTAAWVWGDLAGREVDERLRLAVLYASMSIGVATTREGAATADGLLRAAAAPDATIPTTRDAS